MGRQKLACKAVFWPTPVLKVRTFDKTGFLAEEILILRPRCSATRGQIQDRNTQLKLLTQLSPYFNTC